MEGLASIGDFYFASDVNKTVGARIQGVTLKWQLRLKYLVDCVSRKYGVLRLEIINFYKMFICIYCIASGTI